MSILRHGRIRHYQWRAEEAEEGNEESSGEEGYYEFAEILQSAKEEVGVR